MATLKHSRQRDAIKEYLASTTAHPTADTVYLHVREEFPNISLGTVYRNLNLLTDLGEAIKITAPDGGDRFDAQTMPHYHFYCKVCGNIYDMDFSNMDTLNKEASKHFDGIIESHSALFYGICGNCIRESRPAPSEKDVK